LHLRLLFILSFFPLLLWSQGLDLTGRISFRMQNVAYDENSEIKPDSISDDQYGKTYLVHGLQQYLNIALFGRTSNLDLTFLADLKNNEWNKLEARNLNRISRLTLSMRIRSHEIIFGDFFESLEESFIQSREIRGAKYQVQINDAFGSNSFVNFLGLGGVVEPAISEGDRLMDLYKQYETAGQYRRWLASGALRLGHNSTFNISLKYLWAKDDEGSIESSINEPLANRVTGGDVNFYLWNQNIRLFAEYLISEKDTLTGQTAEDKSYKGGFDFRYNTFKILLYYQNIGYNYYSAGYPYLENDRKGIRGQLAYAFPKVVSLFSDFESYQNNLDNMAYLPLTNTNIVDIGATTFIPNWPEFTLIFGLRHDLSDEITDSDNNPVKIDKFTNKFEGRIGLNVSDTRMSFSTIYLDLDDQSLVSSGEVLGTDQLISSLNLYTSSSMFFFMSGGAVYSRLNLSNGQKNTNLYLYESNRWDFIPRMLKLETTISFVINKADEGGTQDMLSNYKQLNTEISLEYFFTNQASFKAIIGTDTKKFKYNTAQALEVITDPDYGPTYFNGNESYNGLIFGGEFNLIF